MQFSYRAIYLLGLVLQLLQAGCKDKTSTTDQESTKTTVHFPVADYIRSELKEIDSLQLPVTLYKSGAEGSDTALLSTEECTNLAASFMEPDLADPEVARFFNESSFADQSIPSITFNYTSKEETMPLKRVDVVLKPDPSVSDKVRTIYLEKSFMKGDTLVQEKLFWNDGHYYQIMRTKSAGSGTPLLSQVKVVWDPTE